MGVRTAMITLTAVAAAGAAAAWLSQLRAAQHAPSLSSSPQPEFSLDLAHAASA